MVKEAPSKSYFGFRGRGSPNKKFNFYTTHLEIPNLIL